MALLIKNLYDFWKVQTFKQNLLTFHNNPVISSLVTVDLVTLHLCDFEKNEFLTEKHHSSESWA